MQMRMMAVLIVSLCCFAACVSEVGDDGIDDGVEDGVPHVLTEDGQLVPAGEMCTLDDTGEGWTCGAEESSQYYCKSVFVLMQCGDDWHPCLADPRTCTTRCGFCP